MGSYGLRDGSSQKKWVEEHQTGWLCCIEMKDESFSRTDGHVGHGCMLDTEPQWTA